MNVVLSTAYFPNINYLMHFNKSNNIYIDTHEHYQRHSFRNRTNILGANGTILLTVPIKKKTSKTKTKDIKISNESWRKNHIQSIKSAYGSAPYFIHYFDEIEKIINTNYLFLIDLNHSVLQYLVKELNISKKILWTKAYIQKNDTHYLDQRNAITIQNSGHHYQQIFESKFIPNLSVIDLIFNLGPNAKEYLNNNK